MSGRNSSALYEIVFPATSSLLKLPEQARASSAVINWASEAGYSLIDVNISPNGPVTVCGLLRWLLRQR